MKKIVVEKDLSIEEAEKIAKSQGITTIIMISHSDGKTEIYGMEGKND